MGRQLKNSKGSLNNHFRGITMAGKFNIDTIVANINEQPLLVPNRYEVIINGPVEIPRFMSLNCNRCVIPGHNIGSFDHSVVGPIRKIPNAEIFDDVSTSFYSTKYIKEIEIINEWLKKIGGGDSFRIAYYADITGEMRINIYDLQENIAATVDFFEVYPVGISDLELSYDGTEPAEITVNWAYHSYEITSNK
jgi:hypothetical protein